MPRLSINGESRELDMAADTPLLWALRDLLGIEADPLLARVQRWPASMPQYRVGHARHIAAIEAEIEKCPGLALAGNAYHGVGLADCIRDGEEAAQRTVDTFLSTARRLA